MRYLRPFDVAEVKQSQLLLAAEECLGCAVRLVRGTASAELDVSQDERFALALTGGVTLITTSGQFPVAEGDLAFIPQGSAGGMAGTPDAAWLEITAPVYGLRAAAGEARVKAVDQNRFEGAGFAHQSLVDQSDGARSMRINTLQVTPGSGSPDFHIHAFAQMYVIQQGEMTLDIGKARYSAKAGTLIVLPAGVVHRNFNASSAVERHVSFLVPEPKEGEIFDYAVTIHANEAEMLTAIP